MPKLPPHEPVPVQAAASGGAATSPHRRRSLAKRIALFPLALVVRVLDWTGRAAFFMCAMALYAVWFLVYFVLCLFVPLLGMMFPAIVLCIPFTVIVWLNPKAAPLPFWVFPLGALSGLLFIGGYICFVEWIRPPFAPDPFDMILPSRRYRDR